MKRRYVASGGIVLIMAGIWGMTALNAPQSVEAKTVEAVTVNRGTVVHTLAMAGSVVSNQSVTLQYSGNSTTVSSVAVQVGQAVKSGQTLATMANGATITAPFAGRVVASTLDAGDLVPATSSSTSALPSAPVSSGGSFSGHFGRAGFGGAAGAPVATQAVVTAGSPLSITVANVKKVSVLADVSEMDIHAVHVGEKVTMGIEGEPGYRYHGVVSAISDVPSTSSSSPSSSVTYPVSVTLPIGSGEASPWLGMSVELEVETGAESGLVVPVDAVHTMGSGWGVRLGSGQMVPVHLGQTSTNSVVVTQGLRQGESILVPNVGTTTGKVTVEVLPSFGGFAGRSGEYGGFGGGAGFGGGGGFSGF